MQIESVGEQITMFGADTSYGRTFRAHSLRENAREQTSAASSRKSQESSKKMPLYLDLRKRDGTIADVSFSTLGASHGAYMMPSSSAHHSGGAEFVYLPTLTDSQRPGYCLVLNTSECPNQPNPSKLSDILEEEANSRFNLSSRACQGILNRAEKRGKKLPEILRKALEAQVASE